MPRAIVQYEHCLEGQPLACPCVARSASMASSPGIVIVGPQQIWSTQQHHEVGPQHIRSMQQHREVEVGPKQIQSMQHRERKERRQAEAAVADAASVAVVTAVRALSAAISEPSQPGDLRLHIAAVKAIVEAQLGDGVVKHRRRAQGDSGIKRRRKVVLAEAASLDCYNGCVPARSVITLPPSFPVAAAYGLAEHHWSAPAGGESQQVSGADGGSPSGRDRCSPGGFLPQPPLNDVSMTRCLDVATESGAFSSGESQQEDIASETEGTWHCLFNQRLHASACTAGVGDPMWISLVERNLAGEMTDFSSEAGKEDGTTSMCLRPQPGARAEAENRNKRDEPPAHVRTHTGATGKARSMGCRSDADVESASKALLQLGAARRDDCETPRPVAAIAHA